MAEEENEKVAMAECGACRAIIPIDSKECPECNTKFTGLSDEALGECGACNALVPLDSTRCPECGVVFVADDVVDILRTWIADTGLNIRKLFDKFDENDDGTIDSNELRAGLLSLNLADLPPSQVDRLVNEIDADGNGVIDLDEFETILTGEEPSASDEDVAQATQEEASDESEAEESEDDVEEDAGDESDEGEEVDPEPEDAAEQDTEGEEVDDPSDEDEDDATDDEGEGEETAHVDDIENEEFDLEEEEEPAVHPLAALAETMDENDISAQRMFNDLDADGNGMISLSELKSTLLESHGENFSEEDIEAMMEGIDTDGDGMIDVTEFIGSLESLDDHEEALAAHKQEREFPTPMQKRMMSKMWVDNLWPIIHVGFGILIALVLVNALIGPVDGSGGSIEYVPIENNPFIVQDLNPGDVYPCDERYQDGGCANSLTPFAGENGASSMPKGFYLDGVILLLISVVGLCGSLFIHLIKVPAWRARVKAMREFDEDKSDASELAEEEHESEDSEDDDSEDEEVEEDADEDVAEEEDEGEEDDDSIDIGSHIGLLFDDEEVFGTILEFDDDEGTVTIEEDGTGDLVTGYQEDMFLE